MQTLESTSDALHDRVQAFIRASWSGAPTESFEQLARDIAVFQSTHNEPYARLLSAYSKNAATTALCELPAVPTDVFRYTRVSTLPASGVASCFQTSGTTGGAAQTGSHFFRRLDTYRMSALAWAEQTLVAPFAPARIEMPWNVLVFAYNPLLSVTPNSSLTQMMHWFVAQGLPGSRFFQLNELDDLVRQLRISAGQSVPVLLMATAFAWVHVLDSVREKVPLHPSSRLMQTGGFKGRSREIAAQDLRQTLADRFSVSPAQVVAEYGMTELSSQAYASPETTTDVHWRYRPPPWMRVISVDPATLQPLGANKTGIARIEDLANIDSVWSLQTSDEICVFEDDTFELFGRLAGSTPRGCSLATEAILQNRHE